MLILLRRVPRAADRLPEALRQVTGYTLGELAGSSRERRVSYARHLAMFAYKRFAGVGINEMGRMFGRDHSSVLGGVRRIEMECRTRPETARDVTALARLVGA